MRERDPNAPCPSCAKAEANPLSGETFTGCQACEVREVAISQTYFESRKAGDFTSAYIAQMEVIFGAQWERAHRAVNAWAKRRAARINTAQGVML